MPDLGALALPASPQLVAAYLSHLAQNRRLSVATVRLHKAALAAVHRAAGHDDPTDNEGVRRVLQGIARAHGRPRKQTRPLTAEALAAGRATAKSRRPWATGNGGSQQSRPPGGPGWTWRCCQYSGRALINVRRSKTDPEAEGVTLYIGKQAGEALRAIRPAELLLDATTPVFGLSPRQIGRRVKAATVAAGLGEGFTAHSGRVGMAQDLAKSGVELPALMTAGRWKSSRMPARYTERQAADRGAVARYYQESGQ